MAVYTGMNKPSDRDLQDKPDIPEWKKLLIMKKRAGAIASDAASNDDIRMTASGEPLQYYTQTALGDRAGFKGGGCTGTCDLSASGQHWKFLNESRNALKSGGEQSPTGDIDTSHVGITGSTYWPPQSSPQPEKRKFHASCDESDPEASRSGGGSGYRMGEDTNILKKAPTEAKHDLVGQLSSSPETHLLNDTDDEQEDLQYGPGIVDKLKSRFINMSLKESEKSQSNVRRYASLENLLDNGGSFRFTCAQNRERPGVLGNRAKVNFGQRSSNVKKAKSMETLLVNPDLPSKQGLRRLGGRKPFRTYRQPLKGCSPVSMLINENVVIIERPTKGHDSPSRTKGVKRREYGRQVSAPNINEEELPKPDTVKFYKLMFEPQDVRPSSRNFVKSKSSTPKVSANVPSKVGMKGQKSVSSDVPVPRGNTISAKFSAKETVAVNGNVIGQKTSNKDDEICHDRQGVENGEAVEVASDEASKESEVSGVKSISNEALTRIRMCGVTMTFGGMAASQQDTISNVTDNAESSGTELKSSESVSEATPSSLTVKAAAEDEKCEFEMEEHEPISLRNKPEPPDIINDIGISEIYSRQFGHTVGLKNADVVNDSSPSTEENSPTSDDDFLKPSTLHSSKKPNWQKPPPPTTSVVFDFRGKDVKPNIALNPAPFGCKPAKVPRNKKRSGSPPRIDNKNGSVNGVLTDLSPNDDFDDFEDDIDELDIGANLPVLSGIVFVGENIKIGKGALLATRNKKLRIHFDDSATSTFEYPSEASLLDDFSPLSPNNLNDITIASEYNLRDETLPRLPNSTLGGELSNYTPSVLSASESFQLGVSRFLHREPPPPPLPKSPPPDLDEVLKPANPEDISCWSSSSTSDILF